MSKTSKFIEMCINSETDDCIIWPYCKNMKGYGSALIEGRMQRVHRYLCEVVNGPPPYDKHQAAHVCHNSSCVNPRHSQWMDALANNRAKRDAGTQIRGEEIHSAILIESDVVFIRDMLKKKQSLKVLARAFGVSYYTIWDIKNGRTWAHV